MECHLSIPSQIYPRIEKVSLGILSGLSCIFLLDQARSFRRDNANVIVAGFVLIPPTKSFGDDMVFFYYIPVLEA